MRSRKLLWSLAVITIINSSSVLGVTALVSHLSVCLSVGPESVLWQNGWLDPDGVLGGEWDRSRDGCIRWGWSSKWMGSFGGKCEASHCKQRDSLPEGRRRGSSKLLSDFLSSVRSVLSRTSNYGGKLQQRRLKQCSHGEWCSRRTNWTAWDPTCLQRVFSRWPRRSVSSRDASNVHGRRHTGFLAVPFNSVRREHGSHGPNPLMHKDAKMVT